MICCSFKESWGVIYIFFKEPGGVLEKYIIGMKYMRAK